MTEKADHVNGEDSLNQGEFASRAVSLAELAIQLEGSTHGGPRHNWVFESIKTQVSQDPEGALDQIVRLPSSARSVLLMAVSGLGRRALPLVLARLASLDHQHQREAALLLCIWATRGLLCGADRESIASARDAISSSERDPVAASILQSALARLRT
ncbi:MAG: hypothetical protein AAGA03_10990 [Planctomycetota bacterium]